MNKFEAPKIEIIMFKVPEVVGTGYLSNTGETDADEGAYPDDVTF